MIKTRYLILRDFRHRARKPPSLISLGLTFSGWSTTTTVKLCCEPSLALESWTLLKTRYLMLYRRGSKIKSFSKWKKSIEL